MSQHSILRLYGLSSLVWPKGTIQAILPDLIENHAQRYGTIYSVICHGNFFDENHWTVQVGTVWWREKIFSTLHARTTVTI